MRNVTKEQINAVLERVRSWPQQDHAKGSTDALL